MGADDPIVVLGIDQAKVSGWCIMINGGYVESGVARTWKERESAAIRLVEVADSRGVKPWAYFEDHSGIPLQARTRQDSFRRGEAPRRNTATILGMGAARGRWEQSLAAVRVGETRWGKVTPETWRGAVLGLPRNISEDDAKDRALKFTPAIAGHPIEDHNEAEAICIARYGAVETRLRLQKKSRGR